MEFWSCYSWIRPWGVRVNSLRKCVLVSGQCVGVGYRDAGTGSLDVWAGCLDTPLTPDRCLLTVDCRLLTVDWWLLLVDCPLWTADCIELSRLISQIHRLAWSCQIKLAGLSRRPIDSRGHAWLSSHQLGRRHCDFFHVIEQVIAVGNSFSSKGSVSRSFDMIPRFRQESIISKRITHALFALGLDLFADTEIMSTGSNQSPDYRFKIIHRSNCRVQMTGYRHQTTDYKVQIWHYRLQTTDCILRWQTASVAAVTAAAEYWCYCCC